MNYPAFDSILLTDEGVLESFQKANTHEDNDSQMKVMQDDMSSLKKNNTYKLIQLLKGIKVLKNRWVFQLKKEDSGKLVKHKERLVFKGFTQMKEIDFDEIFFLVVMMTSVIVVLGLAANIVLELEQMNVKTASLHGYLNEETYMAQLKGLEVKGKELMF